MPKSVNFNYIPQPKQLLFHQCPTEIVIFGGAVGGGKTRSIAAEPIIFGCQYNCDILFGRASMTDFSKTTLEEFLAICPPELITHWDKKWNIITFPPNKRAINYRPRKIDGDIYPGRTKPTQIKMMPLYKPENLKSLNLGLALCDEFSGVPEESFHMILSRLREPSMHHTEYRFKGGTNPVPGYIRDKYIKLPELPSDVGCTKIPNPYNLEDHPGGEMQCAACERPCKVGRNVSYIPSFIKDNKFLPINYKAKLYAQFPKEYADMILEGNWDAIGGAVFPEIATFKYTKTFQIPPDWTRYMAIDPHTKTPVHVLWVAVSPMGMIYVYRELVITDVVKNICKIIKAREVGEHIFFRIIDTSANSDDELTGINIMDEFSKNGITCAGASKGDYVGYNRIKQAFKDGRIHIFDCCPVFKDQMQSLIWDEYASKLITIRREELQKWRKKYDHLFDCFKYIMISNPRYVIPSEWKIKENLFRIEFDNAIKHFNI